jgi:DNA-binding response OmpR family regulator
MAKILLSEDDAAVREFVSRALEGDGHDVTSTCDGGEAADVLAGGAGGYDLVLADIKMPVMDGIALALKVARDAPDLPIILMTGFADQRERAHGLDSLVADIIAKPFTLDELVTRVSRVLRAS